MLERPGGIVFFVNSGKMKFSLLILYILLFIQVLPSFGLADSSQKIIHDIIIKGNDNTPADVIMTNVRSRPDAVFNEKVASEDSRRIIIMPQIRNVTWVAQPVEGQADKVDIIFAVIEAATVSEVRFEGNKKFNAKKLTKQLPFEKDTFLDSYLVNRGVRELELFYRDKGYYFASVSVDDSLADTDGVITYKIEEGKRLKITKVRFNGRESFPKYKIKSKTKTRAAFPIFCKGKLDDLKLESDVDGIAKYYHDEGFLDAQVAVEKHFSDDNSKLEINFIINEGPRYTVNNVSFAGNAIYTDEEIAAEIKVEHGCFVKQDLLNKAERSIKLLYGRNGYIYTTVRPQMLYTDNPGETDIKFVISEGKKYFLNKLIITGNYETQDKVVRRDFDRHGFLPGKIYDTEAADKARRRLAGSGLFQSVDIEPTGDYPDSRDALVEVSESNTGMLMFGVGVDTNSGILGQFSIEQRNFDASRKPETFKDFITGNAYVGGGQRLKFSIEPGNEMTRANLKFYEPYLNDQPVYLDYNFFLFQRYRESYEERRRGTSVTLGHRFDNDWSLEGTAKVEMVTITDFDYGSRYLRNDDGTFITDPNGDYISEYQRLTPDEVVADAGNNWLTSFKVGVGRNTTDRLFRPSEGYKFTASVEQFGVFGGDFDFTDLSSGITFYNTLYEDIVERRTIWTTRVSGSKIFGYAPTFERFYAGGIGSLRGFDYRGVSPRSGVDRDPIGSKYIILAGTEVTHPLFEETLFGKVFVDSAYVSEGSYRVSAGFGIELLIPQFFQQIPMNFDFGIPLKKDDEDETQLFSFNFGINF